MTVKAINSLLMAGAGACGAVALLAVVGGLFVQLDTEVSREDAGNGRLSPAVHSATTIPTTTPGDAVWSRAFRGSLNDAAFNGTPAASPAATSNISGSLSLVGTIGDALALIRLADGSVVARGVGDDVGDGASSVVTIGPKGVELSVNGQRVLLAKPQPATSTGVVVERAS